MIQITVDPRVLAALKQDFPKPANSAQKALDKYVRTLETMLIASLSRWQPRYPLLRNLFCLSLHKLANKGGQIGSKNGEIGKRRVRVHAWLRNHGLSLVTVYEKGYSFNEIMSEVQFTDLVSLKCYAPELTEDQIANDGLDKNLWGRNAKTNAEIFNENFPDYEALAAEGKAHELFDTTDIDVESLVNYITWREGKRPIKTNDSKNYLPDHQLSAARKILAVAQHTGGKYPQRKKPSNFGRMYYSGTSVQNVNKKLRAAMLGNSWEYDIRSCAIAFKMGSAAEWVQKNQPTSTVDREFFYSVWYLDDKADFFGSVQTAVFGDDCDLTEQKQLDLLKEAFTSLSFGARKNAKNWYSENGKEEKPALVGIFSDEDELERFIADPYVSGFIKEQQNLDKYLFDSVKADSPELMALPYLRTKSRVTGKLKATDVSEPKLGRVTKSKVVSYRFQHGETTVMNIVRAYLPITHQPPLANIHDAIVLRNRLSPDEKAEIERCMRDQTGNPYWRLGENEVKRWVSDNDPSEVL